MQKFLLALAVWFCLSAAGEVSNPSRTLVTAAAPIGGSYNKAVAAGTWSGNQSITFHNQLTIVNAGNQSQHVQVTAYFENPLMRECTSAQVCNVLNPSAQISLYASATPSNTGTWSGGRATLVIPAGTQTVEIAPDSAASFNCVVTFGGPVASPSTHPFITTTGNVRFRITVNENLGAVTASHRVYGSNTLSCVDENSNVNTLSPVFFAINGGRPF